MTDYYKLLDAIEKYYGSGSDQWAEIAKYGIASDNAESILSQVPGVNIVKNANGSIRSYNLLTSQNVTSSAEIAVNSNVPAVVKSFNIPANTALTTVTTPSGETVKQMTFKSGVTQAGKFVAGEVLPSLAAVGVGITLGKTIDTALYNINPDFWDEHEMSTLNPDTWGEIIGTDTTGHRVLNSILGTTPDNKTQVYIDQNALAYMALYMQNKGVFNESETKISKPEDESGRFDFMPESLKTFDCAVSKTGGFWNISKTDSNATSALLVTTDDYGTVFKVGTKEFIQWEISSPESWFNNIEECYAYGKTYNGSNGKTTINGTHTYKGKTKYVNYGGGLSAWGASSIDYLPSDIINHININANNIDNYANRIYDYLVGGSLEKISSIDGVGNQNGAKTPSISSASTVEDVLKELKTQYPELFENAVTQDVVQPDGNTITYTYVPIATPELDKSGNPVSSTSTQARPEVDPSTATEPLLDIITNLIKKDPPTNPPETGSGSTPIVPTVTGKASSLYSIYNPTLDQVNSLGAWLWSSNFIDQLLKLFSSPMDAIIGLHKVYATPATGAPQNIKVGYLDSGVSSKVVTEQYTTIDCGTMNCYEYFGNVLDYNPYTNLRLYLPFIGIIDLSNSDVMRSNINVVYHVDVLSGACLAEVKIIRDGGGGTLYQYAGNACTTLPISSGSYMGVISSVSSVATRALAGFASGGALGAVASGATGILNAQGTNVVHSGGFSGNAGAMGCKKPYLIIERPQTETADNTAKLIGYGSNLYTELSACKGFTAVKAVHVDTVTTATENEKYLIEQALKQGVIIK